MVQNLIGPWVVDILYVVGSLEHKMQLNCSMETGGDPGDSFSEFVVNTRVGGIVLLADAVSSWVELIKTQFHTSVNFTVANLYRVSEGTSEKTFYSTYDVDDTGSSLVAAVVTHQSILSFTTQNGGLLKISLMEDSVAAQTRIPIKDATASVNAIATFLVSTNNWILARDGSYPIGKLNYSGNYNDALERRRFRST